MRITINDVKTSLGITETYDIVNAIRNSGTDKFAQYVPLANADNVAEVGQGLLVSQTLQNEFVTALVDRIGLVVVKKTLLSNPLKKFKKGTLTDGRKIEEIFTDITKAHKYDPEDAEQTLFRREIPNVHTLFHEVNREEFYKQTIQDETLKMAFTSWGSFESFVTSIIQAIHNSAEVDEYKYMKLLIDNYFSKGLFTVVPVATPDTETNLKQFVKKLRATAKKMTLPTGSREYNALAVRTRTDMSDLHLIITADLEAEMDVDVLASAFNMSRTDFLGNVTVIDDFASPGLQAVLVDRDWFMVYDKLQHSETVRNAQGLYWNHLFHVWQVMSVSRFGNAVAFVSGKVDPITQVIVDPSIAAVKQGRTHQFNAVVRATDGKEHDVVWSIAPSTGTTIAEGTSISSDGLLTVAANQLGQITVKATASYTTTETPEGTSDPVTTEHDVVGESIVSIVQA